MELTTNRNYLFSGGILSKTSKNRFGFFDNVNCDSSFGDCYNNIDDCGQKCLYTFYNEYFIGEIKLVQSSNNGVNGDL